MENKELRGSLPPRFIEIGGKPSYNSQIVITPEEMGLNYGVRYYLLNESDILKLITEAKEQEGREVAEAMIDEIFIQGSTSGSAEDHEEIGRLMELRDKVLSDRYAQSTIVTKDHD